HVAQPAAVRREDHRVGTLPDRLQRRDRRRAVPDVQEPHRAADPRRNEDEEDEAESEEDSLAKRSTRATLPFACSQSHGAVVEKGTEVEPPQRHQPVPELKLLTSSLPNGTSQFRS